MMCQRIGWGPISTMGFGRYSVSSRRRVPLPPPRITTGMSCFAGLLIDDSPSQSLDRFYLQSDVAQAPQLFDLPVVHGAVTADAGQTRRGSQTAVGRHCAHGMGLNEHGIERFEQDL